MSYDIHLTIPEDSSGGHLIASLAAQQHITPTQAVERIINEAAQGGAKVSLAPDHEETPTQLVARLRAHKKAHGGGPQPPKNPEGSLAIIGMMAGNAEFSRTMDEIIANRPKRYGFEE
jgi:hypothetical protein